MPNCVFLFNLNSVPLNIREIVPPVVGVSQAYEHMIIWLDFGFFEHMLTTSLFTREGTWDEEK